MFLLKIFYFLKGYVIIGIRGSAVASFVNICRARSIPIWNVSSRRAAVFLRDTEAVYDAANKSGVQIEILRRYSFRESFFERSGWLCLTCAAIFLFSAFISSGYVWSIDVEGCDADTAKAVISAAENFGLHAGVRKSELPDGDNMRDGIIYTVDDVSWAWVYLKGTHAQIRVMEKIAPPKILSFTEPCNIVAAYDGILYFVSTTGGRAVLSAGDRVSAGETVISGEMPESEKTPAHFVHANGEVYAETVRTAACEYPLTRARTRDTGKAVTRRWLRIAGINLPLYFRAEPGFEHYRTEVHEVPFGLCSVKYIETESFGEQIPEDTAVSEACDALGEQIAKELLPGSCKTDERVVWHKTGENKIKVMLSMSFIENIGQKVPIQTEEESDK